ncbi:hypothetical protein K8I61_18975 [bacterium]|nr:hypothetical protein [bacterium]
MDTMDGLDMMNGMDNSPSATPPAVGKSRPRRAYARPPVAAAYFVASAVSWVLVGGRWNIAIPIAIASAALGWLVMIEPTFRAPARVAGGAAFVLGGAILFVAYLTARLHGYI